MALNYNLSKVYALSCKDSDFVNKKLELFVTEIPQYLQELKTGVKNKDYEQVYHYANKLKPTLDLLGLNVAFEEVMELECCAKKARCKKEEVEVLFRSIKDRADAAIKEIKKDFKL